MAKETERISSKDLQNKAYDELNKIIEDPKTSPAVKTQAITQLIRLSEQMQNAEKAEAEAEAEAEKKNKRPSKLTEFLDE